MPDLAGALGAWRALLGEAQVLTAGDTLAAVSVGTFATTARVSAVIRPADRPEVQECLRIANRYRVPVSVTSGGKNWGYGSRVPPVDRCVLLDLARLDQIVAYDRDLATVTVQPGVTFGQIRVFLEQQGDGLLASAVAVTPAASVIGNALERGVTASPLGLRIDHAAGMEVVLPTGHCVHTGLARFTGARAASVARWGLGPALDGLFAQSNLGVVTQMTFFLMPQPALVQRCGMAAERPDQLAPLVDALRQLALGGTVRGPFVLWNDYRTLMALGRYPWTLTGGVTPLTGEPMGRLLRRYGVAAWQGKLTLPAATRAHARADRQLVTRVLRPVTTKLGFSISDGVPNSDEDGSPEPPSRVLRSAYWRKRSPVPADPDPDRDGCGVLWLTGTLPFRGSDVTAACDLAVACFLEHAFEPGLSLVFLDGRTALLLAGVFYDREVPGEDERAMECYRAGLTALLGAGYVPYRLPLGMLQVPLAPHDDYGGLMSSLKQAMDPADVLAPGRYDFRDTWPG